MRGHLLVSSFIYFICIKLVSNSLQDSVEAESLVLQHNASRLSADGTALDLVLQYNAERQRRSSTTKMASGVLFSNIHGKSYALPARLTLTVGGADTDRRGTHHLPDPRRNLEREESTHKRPSLMPNCCADLQKSFFISFLCSR